MWFHVAYYCSMAAATLADPDGATADADKPVIACHVFDSPKPTFRGGRWGREVNNLVMPWWAQAFCSGMTSVMSPMVNPEPVSPRGPPPSWSPGNPRSSRELPQGVPVGYASGDGAPSARSASAA